MSENYNFFGLPNFQMTDTPKVVCKFGMKCLNIKNKKHRTAFSHDGDKDLAKPPAETAAKKVGDYFQR